MTTQLSDHSVRTLCDGRMNRTEAARYLGLSANTLAMWVTQRKGPKFHRVGGRVFYFLHDLDAFIQKGAQQ
jgi:hypothetical protein